MSPFLRLMLFVSMALAAPFGSAQIVLGQVDDFQDGTVQGWNGFDFVNNPTGGPAGVGDKFLQVTSYGGFGQGSRLATYNNGQWSGNYSAAGVSAISLDIRNQGNLTLNMRVCLIGTNGDRWTNTLGVSLAVGGGWQHVVFSLDQSGMTRVLGSGTYQDTITSVNQILIRHDANAPSSGGSSIASQMGLDNIRAVPEPATLAALATGILCLRRPAKRRG